MPWDDRKDYKTSKGRTAPDRHWIGQDDLYRDRQYIKQYIEETYTGSKVVRAATQTYNCHGYIHAARHAWFNEITRFLEDDYAPFTPGTLQKDDVVVYWKNDQATHSAKITQLSGNSIVQLRSKWGALSEVLHGPNNVPKQYGDIHWYLRRRDLLLKDDPDYFDVTEQEDIDDLIVALLDRTGTLEVHLASTIDVILHSYRSFSETTALALYGERGEKKLLDTISKLDSLESALPILVALSINPTRSAVRSTAQCLLSLHDDDQGTTTAELAAHRLLLEMDSAVRLQEEDFDALSYARTLTSR